jgi:hypothetical protein
MIDSGVGRGSALQLDGTVLHRDAAAERVTQ